MVAALLTTASPAFGQADPGSTFRVAIDRVDLEPAAVGGQRLRVYVSALSIDGQVLDLAEPKSIKLVAGGSEIRAPYALGTFAATQTNLSIVFVIQATSDYADALRVISEAAGTGLLDHLPDRTQVAILTYGVAVGAGKLAPLKTARGRIQQLATEAVPGEPLLLDTLDRALALLRRKAEPPTPPVRKMIVVIGDGRDRANDRERVTKLGERANREGVRIHTFGHTPGDVRRPLLLLGELSKQSLGTFRWLRKDATTVAAWQPRFEQLLREIQQQVVLTYFLTPDVDPSVAGQKLKLTTAGRTSLTALNTPSVPPMKCNGEDCDTGYCADACAVAAQVSGRGVLGWVFTIVAIVLGALLLLGVIGYVMTKRKQAAGAPVPGVPGQPGSQPPGVRVASQPPGSVPPVAPPAPQYAPESGPRIYIMSGARAGETLGLRHGFMIGAAPTNDLVIADGFASGQHAQIGMDAQGNCWVADLGSTNGTFLNGVRVTQKLLDHGVSLKIGSTEIRFLAQ